VAIQANRTQRKFHALNAWQICTITDGYKRVTSCSHSEQRELQPVKKPDDAMMPHMQIATVTQSPSMTGGSRNSVDRRIRAFLNGESHGEDVLGALYGGIANEPVPERLRALIKP
jgi:hypothetical protein